ncbi:Ig-like domain-containing protein [uncultured Jannaschia sp.]|uniref:cadherin-like domain-containing protein n=1 Tax=uncultured Jannaschia sp. TaxID=293347 RepID=UPI0026384DC1|nr:Ig-like domain-containing protein [uncultured Jannaschia sp.]
MRIADGQTGRDSIAWVGRRHAVGRFIHTPLAIGAAEHLANDGDLDRDPLTIVVVSGPDAAGGSVALSGDEVTFTSAAGFVGMTRLNYGLVDTNRATVLDGRATLEPSGDRWRMLSLREPLTVGTDTVLRFTSEVGKTVKITSIASIPATSTARRRIRSCSS